MADWSIATLWKLDVRYAGERIHPHQRPFRAALDILGSGFSIGLFENPEVRRVMDAYRRMLPEVDANWPGMGTGLAAVVDQVRRVTAPVVFGEVSLDAWSVLGFASDGEWWAWCREDREIAAATSYAVADLLDFAYGVDEVVGDGPDEPLWRMAASALSDCANTLPQTFTVDSVVQQICLTVELSLKASLVRGGASPAAFGGRGGEGHDVRRLAARLAAERPHRDDARTAAVAAAMPPYVGSRYAPAGLTRLAVVRLALGAQFVAAGAIRRWSERDLAGEMASGAVAGFTAALPRPRLNGGRQLAGRRQCRLHWVGGRCDANGRQRHDSEDVHERYDSRAAPKIPGPLLRADGSFLQPEGQGHRDDEQWKKTVIERQAFDGDGEIAERRTDRNFGSSAALRIAICLPAHAVAGRRGVDGCRWCRPGYDVLDCRARSRRGVERGVPLGRVRQPPGA